MSDSDAAPVVLPKMSLSVFNDCPRGFEDELADLLIEYATEAVRLDRKTRAAMTPTPAVVN